MKNKHSAFLFFWVSVCIVLLISCSNKNIYPSTPALTSTTAMKEFRYDWKNGWLKEPSCMPPCWEGIIPGKTTVQDAKDILKNMQGVQIIVSENTFIEWIVNGSYDGHVIAEEGSTIIQYTSIYFYDQNLTLEDSINIFGEPVNVQINNCDHNGCPVYVIYPKSGLALRLLLPSIKNGVIIDKPSELVGLVFFTPSIDNYLKIPPFIGFELKPWIGYGAYQE